MAEQRFGRPGSALSGILLALSQCLDEFLAPSQIVLEIDGIDEGDRQDPVLFQHEALVVRAHTPGDLAEVADFADRHATKVGRLLLGIQILDAIIAPIEIVIEIVAGDQGDRQEFGL